MKLRNLLNALLAIAILLPAASCKEEKPPFKPQTGPDAETPTVENIMVVADKIGKSVKGVVYVDSKTPVEGAVVSDGITCTTTDKNGQYWLNSQKQNGYVFVSIPNGYTVEVSKNVYPQFFKYTTKQASEMEQIDFKLIPYNKKDYVVLTLADIHLAGRNQDTEHYQNWFMKDVNELIADYKAKGKDVFCMTLGDQSWNTYYFATDIPAPFTLTETMPYLEMLQQPTFNTMGNHDNDPKEQVDFLAENAWRRLCGPSYYSFNIGDIHYIVLDNIVYTNPGPGTLSDSCYSYYISSLQMSWLKADLAALKDKTTPIYVLTHCPMHEKPKLDANGKPQYGYKMKDGAELAALLKNFNVVNVFTGHAHTNYGVVNHEYSNIREYNVASVCATWWWTGKRDFAGNHICRDGSVGGYRVLEIDGKKMSTYFKSLQYPADYQFRTYDCNECQITAAKYCTAASNSQIATEITKLTGAAGAIGCEKSNWHQFNNRNEVLINVFAYDPRWKVEVTENGKQLAVTRENGYDPLHIISQMCYRLQNKGTVTATHQPALTSHLFRVTASSPTSTLEVKVTDHEGRVHSETMTRPKPLTTTMH